MRFTGRGRARHTLKRTPRYWICPCGSTSWFEEIPSCGGRLCLRRWWLAVGLPAGVLILGLILVGSVAWMGSPGCSSGWVPEYGTSCTRE